MDRTADTGTKLQRPHLSRHRDSLSCLRTILLPLAPVESGDRRIGIAVTFKVHQAGSDVQMLIIWVQDKDIESTSREDPQNDETGTASEIPSLSHSREKGRRATSQLCRTSPSAQKHHRIAFPTILIGWFATALEMVLNQVTFKDLITVVDTLQILQSTISKGPSTLLFLPSIGISSCQLGGDAGNQEFILIVLVIILVLVFAQTTSIGLIWRPSTFLSQPDFTRAHVIDCRRYGFKIQFWKV
ncbi:predicted protein [Histoplasma capsulatum H143]|uniref:Uncharacterized protein n=1 Tax=Ajellomyces capsulatus (strain H143) TaxID=544712 RepID=C6HLA6_AJECH|nr:predicted protein [Histoplasma capsulatum H143]